MDAILVSSCLLGALVRYDGSAAPCSHPLMARLASEGRLVPFCPEVAAGLPTPRPAIELAEGDGDTLRLGQGGAYAASGADYTAAFLDAAARTVALCREKGLRAAVLKDRSPSCGSQWVHDGSFSGTVRPGVGVVTAALRAAGVRVFSEKQWEDLARFLGEETGESLSCPAPSFI